MAGFANVQTNQMGLRMHEPCGSTHARHGFLRIGSDTAQVLADTPVPVIFVRGTVAAEKSPQHRALDYASIV